MGATHGIFSGQAIERLEAAPIVECVTTDAVPCPAAHESERIHYISVAKEFAEAIYHVYTETSVSSMFGADLTL